MQTRQWHTNVISREAAAALMWRLGWRTALVLSNARENVPTALQQATANLYMSTMMVHESGTRVIYVNRTNEQFWKQSLSIIAIKGGHVLTCWTRLTFTAMTEANCVTTLMLNLCKHMHSTSLHRIYHDLHFLFKLQSTSRKQSKPVSPSGKVSVCLKFFCCYR